MSMKTGIIVFVSVVCSITVSQTLGVGLDEEGFGRSNYYTNDQGNNVPVIHNQAKNSDKRHDKKLEHFRNNHAKYSEPKKGNNKDYRRVDDPNMLQTNNGYQSYKVVDGRTNSEKRLSRGDPRTAVSQAHRSHFHIASDRVQYHNGGIAQSNERPSLLNSDRVQYHNRGIVQSNQRPSLLNSDRVQYHNRGIAQSNGQPSLLKSDTQRQARKSFNDQGNSNWRWGFRRKQSKDHPLKDTNSYAGGNHLYKSKNPMNAQSETMVRNNHIMENNNVDGNARQNVIHSESKMVGIETAEQHQRPFAPRQDKLEDGMHRALGQQGQQWNSREGAEVADYRSDNNQRIDMQPKDSRGWMPDGSQNSLNAPGYASNEMPSPYRNPPIETPNVMQPDQSQIDHIQNLNGPVENKVLNAQMEKGKLGTGLLQQIPNSQLKPQLEEVRYNHETRKNQQIQNLPQIEAQRVGQFQEGNPRYENRLDGNIPRNDNVQQPETVKVNAQYSIPRMSIASRDENQNQDWDGSSQKINAHQTKISNADSKYNPGNSPSSPALKIQQHQPGPPEQSQDEIRYLVLSPKEFNQETLRRTLGEPEKPRGIPYCTLEEYKMERASLKAKSNDGHERDMQYIGTGSINELISRLKRNDQKNRASAEGPELPRHTCESNPSTCEVSENQKRDVSKQYVFKPKNIHCEQKTNKSRVEGKIVRVEDSTGTVRQTEAVHEKTTMCWAESLTRPTVSAEDLGINFRITPSYLYDHLRGRLPVISLFDYTACTSCSTPCKEPPTTCRTKMKRNVPFLHKLKRTPDEILLSEIIRNLQNTTAIPELPDPEKALPNALEEEKIIEKYLTALMEDQISRQKSHLKIAIPKAGSDWLEKLLKELAENKLKSKLKINDNVRLERRSNHARSKLSLTRRG